MIIRVSDFHEQLIVLTARAWLPPASVEAVQTPMPTSFGDVHPKLWLQFTARCRHPLFIAN
eukprot:10644900-Karenia_brevis.AAC.1